METKTIYLPGLNGLRAIAALSVIIVHTISGSITTFGLPFYYAFPMGQFSVTLFFVISGFLITYLLLIEKEKYQLSVKDFYIRRVLRIWPLYYLYIGICVLFSLFDSTFQQVLSPHIYWYIFFAANVPFVFNQIIDVCGHLWTIGVEEQFYAFWPWIMKNKNNRLISIIIVAIITIYSLKVGSYFLFGRQSGIYLMLSVLRFQSMMLGALGAIMYYNKNTIFIRIASNKILQIVSWAAFFLTGFGVIHIPSLIAHEFISVVSVALILSQIVTKNPLINLENNICHFLGQISYGIYIFHPLCITLLLPLLKPLPISVLAKSLLGCSIILAASTILAYLSYHYYESLFLKLKGRFTVIKTKTSNVPVVEKEYVLQ